MQILNDLDLDLIAIYLTIVTFDLLTFDPCT